MDYHLEANIIQNVVMYIINVSSPTSDTTNLSTDSSQVNVKTKLLDYR